MFSTERCGWCNPPHYSRFEKMIGGTRRRRTRNKVQRVLCFVYYDVGHLLPFWRIGYTYHKRHHPRRDGFVPIATWIDEGRYSE